MMFEFVATVADGVTLVVEGVVAVDSAVVESFNTEKEDSAVIVGLRTV